MEALRDRIMPWSEDPTPDETQYREAGYSRTKGTVFSPEPPSDTVLLDAFERSHDGESVLSVGGKALCKHYARSPCNPHPFWPEPVGSDHVKNELASQTVVDIMKNSVWRNVYHLCHDTIILEIRVESGYGARWNLTPLVFRGFLEPEFIICN